MKPTTPSTDAVSSDTAPAARAGNDAINEARNAMITDTDATTTERRRPPKGGRTPKSDR